MNKEHKIGNLKNLCVFVLIFATDAFITFANINEMTKRVFQVMILAGLLLFIFFRKRVNKHKFYICIVLITCVFASMLINTDFGGENIVRIFLLIAALLLSCYVTKEEFQLLFVTWMYRIALLSLILFPISFIFNRYLPFWPTITNIGNTQVFFMGLTNILKADSLFVRNYGPFWEPGVFAIYLNIALILSLENSKLKSIKNIVFILAILSTVSTAGIVILCIILFARIFLSKGEFNAKIIFGFFGVVLLIALLNNEVFMYTLTSKLDKTHYSYMSTQARLLSITGNLEIFKNNVLFGAGSSNYSDLYIQYALSHGAWDRSNTNSLIGQFAMYGLVFGCVFLNGIAKYASSLFNNKMERICMILAVFLMMCAEPLQSSFLFNTIVFYGYDCITKKSANQKSRTNLRKLQIFAGKNGRTE